MEQNRKHAFSELCDIYKGFEPGKITFLVVNAPTEGGGVKKVELNITVEWQAIARYVAFFITAKSSIPNQKKQLSSC